MNSVRLLGLSLLFSSHTLHKYKDGINRSLLALLDHKLHKYEYYSPYTTPPLSSMANLVIVIQRILDFYNFFSTYFDFFHVKHFLFFMCNHLKSTIICNPLIILIEDGIQPILYFTN